MWELDSHITQEETEMERWNKSDRHWRVRAEPTLEYVLFKAFLSKKPAPSTGSSTFWESVKSCFFFSWAIWWSALKTSGYSRKTSCVRQEWQDKWHNWKGLIVTSLELKKKMWNYKEAWNYDGEEISRIKKLLKCIIYSKGF